MAKQTLLLAALTLVTFCNAVEKCYPPFGCYSLSAPWWTISRPFAVLPKAPEEINTRFLLYTREEPEEVELVINKTGILLTSEFDGNKPTRIIVHGFLHSVHENWVGKMKNELLKAEDSNVIFVEWGDGAGIPYMQAVANARVVGDQIAHLIKFLNRDGNNDLKKIHIIGQGLGSHVAGYAGRSVKIGRITALDPPQPYFSGDSQVRLQRSDADFVDVIHTDGSSLLILGFGMDQAIGHADYYVNKGKNQPGCGDLGDRITGAFWDLISLNQIGVREGLACSHRRAIDLFTESINTPCPFAAFSCQDENDFESGSCRHCDTGKCSRLGFHSEKFVSRGKYYLTTSSASPFCHNNFVITVTTSVNQKATTGRITAQVTGKSGKTKLERVNNASEKIRAQQSFATSLQAGIEIGQVTQVQLNYEDTTFLFKQDLVIDKAIVSRLDDELQSEKTYFCAKNTIVKHKGSITLKPTSTTC